MNEKNGLAWLGSENGIDSIIGNRNSRTLEEKNVVF
jgi:hypothetical protein